MKILKEYKTFNNETGEIRVDVQLVERGDDYEIIQNGETTYISSNFDDLDDYYERLKEMDYYLASSLKYYEVYVVRY